MNPSRRSNTNLKQLYTQFLEKKKEDFRESFEQKDRENLRQLNRLAKRGVKTVADLVEKLTNLPPKLKHFSCYLISLLKLHETVDVLLEMTADAEYRMTAASTLTWFSSPKRAGNKVKRFFMEIGQRELEAEQPDRFWLEGVIQGLGWGFSDDREAVDLIVTIYERTDLPGWLRGDAADKLGTCLYVSDRRTHLFRRCRDTAIEGIKNESIEMQFGSMYLICSMASNREKPVSLKNDPFYPAQRKLRQIAKQDHRLAPGYWWPMSAEAEDALGCIQTGRWPQPEAADRWFENAKRKKRGERERS